MTRTNNPTIRARAMAAGQAATARTTRADSTMTATGRRPHENPSIISTKAHEKLPRAAITSPAGWSMCHR